MRQTIVGIGAVVLVLTNCNDGPTAVGGIDAGTFELYVAPGGPATWIVPAPAGHPQAGQCVTLQDGKVIIEGPSTLSVEGVFSASHNQFLADTLRGTYRSGIVFDFGTHADTAIRQWEGQHEYLTVRQLFPGTDHCGEVRHTLRYRRLGL